MRKQFGQHGIGLLHLVPLSNLNAMSGISHPRRLLLTGALVFRCALMTNHAFAEESATKNKDDFINVLSSSPARWADAIRFQAAFKYYKGLVSSIEEGLEGKVSKSASAPYATGLLAKEGEQYRMRLDYEQPPRDASIDGTGRIFSDVSFDEVLRSDAYLTYLPKYESFGNSVVVSRKEEKDIGSFRGLQSSRAILTPFNFGGGIDRGPVLSLRSKVQEGETWNQEVTVDGDERTTIRVEWKDDQGMRRERFVTFWTQPPIPVVERVHDHFENSRRRISGESVAKADQFVQCDGGMFPKHVVSVSGPITTRKGSTGYVAEEWIATEVQPRPTVDAFQLTVPAGTSISGLKDPPKTSFGPAVIRLADYSLNDLEVPGLSGQGIVTELTPKPFTRIRIVGIIVTAIVLALLLLLVLRKRLHAI